MNLNMLWRYGLVITLIVLGAVLVVTGSLFVYLFYPYARDLIQNLLSSTPLTTVETLAQFFVSLGFVILIAGASFCVTGLTEFRAIGGEIHSSKKLDTILGKLDKVIQSAEPRMNAPVRDIKEFLCYG